MLVAFLNKPFPGNTPSIQITRQSFFIGCFIALFLILFQPFGISQWNTDYKILKLAGYGLVSFIVPIISSSFQNLIIPKTISEEKWKVWHEMIAIIVILLLIAFGNLIYSSLINIMTISLEAYFSAIIYTFLIGIFPVFIHVLTKHNKLLKKNVSEAIGINNQIQKSHENNLIISSEFNNESEQLIFKAENEKDKVEIQSKQLLYIESADNYSNIIYIENGNTKKLMIRSSLKRLETQHTNPAIIRCHRTFIVNLKNVKSIEGNAAGYKLSFSDAELSVPVSRNYGNLIINKLKLL